MITPDVFPAHRTKLGTTFRGEREAERELVRGCEQHRPPSCVAARHTAGVVDLDGSDLESRVLEQGPVALVAEGFGRHLSATLLTQHATEQPQRLVKARTDHDGVGIGSYAARPRQVGGNCLAQLGTALRVSVAERRRGCRGHRPTRRRQPRLPGEGADVGLSRTQVVGQGVGRGFRCWRHGGVEPIKAATLVPEPCRATSHPSADNCA